MAYGGRVERWAYPLSPLNLVPNASFEVLGVDGKPEGWASTAGFSVSDVARSGARSLKLTRADLTAFADAAIAAVSVVPGWHMLSGWVKTVGIIKANSGVRIQVPGKIFTPIAAGTLEWIEGRQWMSWLGSDNTVQCYAYSEPDGEAYFDDLSLIRHNDPVADAFMRYPNFLGGLWIDGPQAITLWLVGSGPALLRTRSETGALLADLPVTLVPSGSVESFSTAALSPGRYLGQLVQNGVVHVEGWINKMARPPLRVDPDQVWVQPNAAGMPTRRFPVVVYHTSGYYTDAAGWTAALSPFFPAIKADLYINYWLGLAPMSSLQALGQALRSWGMAYWDTVNNKYVGGAYPVGPDAQPDAADLIPRAHALTGQPGIAGWYTADERRAEATWGVWAQRKILRDPAPDLPSLVVQLADKPEQLPLWRDIADVLGVDPYPVRGNNVNPDGSHKLEEVADWTAAALAAVQESRPVWTVVQFFGGDRAGAGFRFPTEPELRSMTWLAICAGAQGIGYWSLGAKGLAWLSEPFYTQAKEALIRVVDEVKAEESWLIGTRLAGPSVPSGILAIRRQANGVAKVFSVNRTVTIVTDGVRTWDPYGTQFWSE